jgi:hypothetical protein
MEIVLKKIEELKPYENNPRHNEKAVNALAESIKNYGFKVPCIIDKNGVIVTGHTRYKACQKLGYKEIPCIIADDLTEEQINEFRLADNRVGEISTWDKNRLILEVKKLPSFEPLKFGFQRKELLKRKDIYSGDPEGDREDYYSQYNLKFYDPNAVTEKWQMPKIQKTNFVPNELMGFNYAMSNKNNFDKAIHFFIDDYQFERLWNSPEIYFETLCQYSAVLTPDFSLFTDMPLAMKMWNVYRSRLLGQVWQRIGITVIPTLTWSEPETYDFCFDGIEQGGTVAISTLGIKQHEENNSSFKQGLTAAIKAIKPKTILCYGGKVDFDFGKIEVKYFENTVTERMKQSAKKK